MEEAFEFPSLSASSPSMICIAGDIIAGGKLLPFCAAPPPPPADIIGKTSTQVIAADDSLQLLVGVGSSSRVTGRAAGGYRKLRKPEEEDANIPVSLRRSKKSRWYVLAFGFRSAAMELKEIRRRIIRQQHKSLESMAAEELVKKKEWGPWKQLLRSLSCMYM